MRKTFTTNQRVVNISRLKELKNTVWKEVVGRRDWSAGVCLS
jgi:hypothetical protein